VYNDRYAVVTSVIHRVEDIMNRSIHRLDRWFIALGFGIASAISIAPVQAQQMCGGGAYPFPYTDVSAVGAAFCPGIMEAYVTGVSKGTTPTTFSPNNTVTRVQMTTFLQRSLDQGLARTSRRAALNQWWTPQNATQTIAVGGGTQTCAADGEAIWTTTASHVVQVQASTGNVLNTWIVGNSFGILVAGGKAYVTDDTSGLYVIDSTAGTVSIAASVGKNPGFIAFDGRNLWIANTGAGGVGGSVAIVTPQATPPYPVTNVTTGFTAPNGILYDGANIWVTDGFTGKLFKLDAAGVILQTVTVGAGPVQPVFDGANIWVPNSSSNSITVVQASTGNVVATISADANNHLNHPFVASFDGERILVTNAGGGESVSVFKAADLSFIANVTTGAGTLPQGACSDGINFFVGLGITGNLLRF
jgi:hypothetical protein